MTQAGLPITLIKVFLAKLKSITSLHFPLFNKYPTLSTHPFPSAGCVDMDTCFQRSLKEIRSIFNNYFLIVRKEYNFVLFHAPPFRARPKKNPQAQMMSLGISLFYPQTFPVQHTGPRECCIYVTDRSSGSRIILLAAPSLPTFAGQWHQLRRSSPITAAGPLPICTGFSIKPLRGIV